MLEKIAILSVGFSFVSALLLLSAYLLVYKSLERTWLSRLSGVVLLIGLGLVQLAHWRYIENSTDLFHSKTYVMLLFTIAPAFYFFSREGLRVNIKLKVAELLHLVPLVVSQVLDGLIAVPISFVLGSGYALRLAFLVYGLRAQRKHFRVELFAFSVFFLLALVTFVAGATVPFFNGHGFFITYALLIGAGFFLSIYILLMFPDILTNTYEAARSAYAMSTLKNIDCDKAVSKLKHFMEVEKIYVNENMNLSLLAQQLDLSSHQLSELINTKFGVGFARYIREYRVQAAKRMLIDEPEASVLSIGLSVGFTSQSNFYAAFREIAGDVPGKFRKR